MHKGLQRANNFRIRSTVPDFDVGDLVRNKLSNLEIGMVTGTRQITWNPGEDEITDTFFLVMTGEKVEEISGHFLERA